MFSFCFKIESGNKLATPKTKRKSLSPKPGPHNLADVTVELIGKS